MIAVWRRIQRRLGEGDREVEVDPPLLDHHPLEDGADEALAFPDGERGQGRGDAPGKARHIQLEVRPLKRGHVLSADRLQARLHVGALLTKQALAALKLTERDQPGRVGIEEPVLLAIHLGQLLLELADLFLDDPMGPGRRLRAQPPIRLDDQGRTLEMPTHFWSGIGHVVENMHEIGYNVRLDRTPFQWFAEFRRDQIGPLPPRFATAGDGKPRKAVQRAALETLGHAMREP